MPILALFVIWQNIPRSGVLKTFLLGGTDMKDLDRLRKGQTFALTEGLVDESDLPRRWPRRHLMASRGGDLQRSCENLKRLP